MVFIEQTNRRETQQPKENKKKGKKEQQKTKNWFITGYDECLPVSLKKLEDDSEFLIITKEKGISCGRDHYHAVIIFNYPKTFNVVKNMINIEGTNVAECKKLMESIDYCSKLATSYGQIYTFGEYPSKYICNTIIDKENKKDRQLSIFYQSLLEGGMNDLQILSKYPSRSKHYFEWREKVLSLLENKENLKKPIVFFVHGDPSAGKTLFCEKIAEFFDYQFFSTEAKSTFFDGLTRNHQIMRLDEIEKGENIQFFNKIFDKQNKRWPVKYGSVENCINIFYLTSNFNIIEIFGNDVNLPALMRRLTIIMQFENIGEKLIGINFKFNSLSNMTSEFHYYTVRREFFDEDFNTVLKKLIINIICFFDGLPEKKVNEYREIINLIKEKFKKAYNDNNQYSNDFKNLK